MNFTEKINKFIETLTEEEVDMFLEMLGDKKENISIDKKKAYIIEALPGNKTRIIEDDA